MRRLRGAGKTIGFVPTMGALHEGHLSLVERSKKENDVTAVSIFVNPAQFGPKEDFGKYPRPAKKDKALLLGEKTDYLFMPSPAQMYPEGFSSYVELPDSLAAVLCGAFRPGHFRGVATIVVKLFNLVLPRRAYFGLKDYQQCAVIKKVVTDFNFDLELCFAPTVREKDGLAMSSRNAYLSKEERKRASAVSQTLFAIREELCAGKRNLPEIRRRAIRKLKSSADKIDYLEIADPETLVPLKKTQPRMVALAACFVGKTRLIDNVIISLSKNG